MIKKQWWLLALSTMAYSAEFVVTDLNETVELPGKSWIALPYAFSTESMGFTAGGVLLAKGYIQPNMSLGFSVYGGAEQDVQKNGLDAKARSYGIVGGFAGYRFSYYPRLFINFFADYSYYPNQRLYLDGGNDSDPINVIRTQGNNNWGFMDFRIVLPLGECKDDPVRHYVLSQGRIVNRQGYGGGMPFAAGRTILGFQPFYQKWTLDRLEPERQWVSSGLRVYIKQDNTDYEDNPSRGYSFTLRYTHDFGLGESLSVWNAVDFAYTHYFTLPATRLASPNILAFHVWTAYSPSWRTDEKRLADQHRPPPWEGARLGGMFRMRGYDTNRFSDKAAVYFAMEYRSTIYWNPVYKADWAIFPIDWFQIVPFFELGRVAERYDPTLLLTNMKYDAGISLRALAAKIPVRFEIAGGEEAITSWVMINQPF